jgi:predicted ATPase/DNA-binding SARP family transcriptional activator
MLHLSEMSVVASRPELEIRLFGEPGFYEKGTFQNLRLPTKSFEVLCLLALHSGQPIDRAKVAFTLWPDDPEEDAKANLRRHVYLLSRTLRSLGASTQLVATTASLMWTTQGSVTIDVVEFLTLSAAPETIDRAAAMYTRDLLSNLYGDWLEEQRERLRGLQLRNLLELSGRHVQADPERALTYAERARHIDSWHEEALRSAMLARAHLGDRAGAMQIYREFEQRLKAEFGTEPAAETKQTLQMVRVVEARNHNLPRQLTSFVGRERVLEELLPIIQGWPLVTLVGAGGVGKTRCAIALAAEALSGFSDGVWLVELAHVSDPALVSGIVARALNAKELPQTPMLDSVLAHLERKQCLLVLDNCEHVIEAARRLAIAILQSCPDVRIVATSREPLHVAGEQVFRVPALDVPPEDCAFSADRLLEFGAPLLFTERARSVDNRFAVTGENAADVAEICRHLDGIPLAIELAAARIKVLSPGDLARKLGERFRLLTGGDRGALPHHQTMRALIDWSYDFLSDEERRVFRRLAIFAGGFTLEFATSVCGDGVMDDIGMLDVITSLVDKSLVQGQQETNGIRYAMLESTRQYGLEKLSECGEYGAVARKHAETFAVFAEELEAAWQTTPDSQWLEKAALELENSRAALHWALRDRNDALIGQRVAGTLRRVWVHLAKNEGLRWIQMAQMTLDASTPLRVAALLDVAEAQICQALAQYKACHASARRALQRFREADDPFGIAVAQSYVGFVLVSLGAAPEAESILTEALQIARRLDAPKLIAAILKNLAVARAEAGDLPGARAYFVEELAIVKAARNERLHSETIGTMAQTEFRFGNIVEALRLCHEALDAFREQNDRENIATTLSNIAAYLVALERYDEALDRTREALNVKHGGPAIRACVLQHLAAIEAFRPATDKETSHSHRIAAARLLGYVDKRLTALGSLREYAEQQEYERIVRHLQITLGLEELAKLMADGRSWSGDRATAEFDQIISDLAATDS